MLSISFILVSCDQTREPVLQASLKINQRRRNTGSKCDIRLLLTLDDILKEQEKKTEEFSERHLNIMASGSISHGTFEAK